jgi:tetrahydromethanopterin S-methyltransferase subunit F
MATLIVIRLDINMKQIKSKDSAVEDLVYESNMFVRFRND